MTMLFSEFCGTFATDQMFFLGPAGRFSASNGLNLRTEYGFRPLSEILWRWNTHGKTEYGEETMNQTMEDKQTQTNNKIEEQNQERKNWCRKTGGRIE